jgi:hypothetical protein
MTGKTKCIGKDLEATDSDPTEVYSRNLSGEQSKTMKTIADVPGRDSNRAPSECKLGVLRLDHPLLRRRLDLRFSHV